MKSSTGNGAPRREIACISDFKLLGFFLLLFDNTVFCRTQFKRAEVNQNVGNFPVKWPILLGPFQNGFITFFSMCMCLECHSASHPLKLSWISFY